MAHQLSTLDFQQQVDYVNWMQKRVSGETFALERKTTLTLLQDVGEYALPDDLVALEGIYSGVDPLAELGPDQLLSFLSGATTAYYGEQGYVIVGTTLYVLPVPTSAGELTVVYYARSGEFQSDDELELDAVGERVLDNLIDAYMLLDYGEPEMGVNVLAQAETDLARARRANRGRGGHSGRMRVMGESRL